MPIPDRPIREKGVCGVRSGIGWSNLVINKLFSATVTVFSPVLALIRAPTIIRNNTSNKKNDKNTPSMEANMNLKNRSEEHTSELQSLMRNSYAVFCLKKKKQKRSKK